MKILYISQFFPPEVGAAANRARNLVKFWSKEGVEITVVSEIPNYPSGLIKPPYSNRIIIERPQENVKIIRIPVVPCPSGGTIRQKLVNNFSFYANAHTILPKLLCDNFDLIFTTAPPLFSIHLGYFLSKKYDAPLILDVRDVWPEILLAQEGCNIACKLAINALTKFMKFFYRCSELIVSPVPYILRYLRRYGVSDVHWTPNGVDFSEIDKIGPANFDKTGFTVIYAGILGRNHGTATLLKVIEKAKDIDFWVIGDGKDRPLFENSSLENLKYLGVKSWEETIAHIKAADVGIVMLRDNIWMRNAFPVKAIDYLAVGKPVVMSIKSVFSELLRQHGAGLSANLNNVSEIVSYLNLLKNNAKLRKEMSQNARELARKQFDMALNAVELLAKLRAIAEQYGLLKRGGKG